MVACAYKQSHDLTLFAQDYRQHLENETSPILFDCRKCGHASIIEAPSNPEGSSEGIVVDNIVVHVDSYRWCPP